MAVARPSRLPSPLTARLATRVELRLPLRHRAATRPSKACLFERQREPATASWPAPVLFGGDVAMKRSRSVLLVLALVAMLITGCGRSYQKDVNKDKDRPKPAEKEG